MDDVSEYRYTAILKPQPGGGFSLEFPAIPEIWVFGKTASEACQTACEVLRRHIEVRIETGERVPQDVEIATIAACFES